MAKIYPVPGATGLKPGLASTPIFGVQPALVTHPAVSEAAAVGYPHDIKGGMRRILSKVATNEYTDVGDTSALAEPGVEDDLVEGRMNR